MSNIINFVLNLRNNVSGPLYAIGQSVGNATTGFGKLAVAAASAFSIYKIAQFGKEILGAGMNMEQTRVQFETFTGSAEKGNAVIAQLQKFSLATPFDDEQVLKAGKSLLAFGSTTEGLQSELTQIGNISSATGKDFNELVTIYGKARTAGTLYAEDINQLVEAGVPIISEFAKQLRVPESQVKKLASQGKISFGMLQKGFEALGGATGKWGSLMDKQSKTVAGRLSSLVGFAQNLGSQLGEAMLPLAGALVDRGSEALQWVKENKEKFGAIFQPLLKAVKPLTDALGRIYASLGLTGDTGTLLEAIFNKVGYAIQVISPFVETAATALGSLYDAGLKIVTVFSEWFKKNTEAKSSLLTLYNGFKVVFGGIGAIAGKVFGGIATTIDGILNKDFSKIGAGLKNILLAPAEVVTDPGTYKALDDKAPEQKNFFGKSAAEKAREQSDAVRKSAALKANAAANAAKTKTSTKVGDVSGTRPTNITIKIEKQIGVEKLYTQSVKDGGREIGESLKQLLTAAVSDTSLLVQKQ